jgi:hypothetical protein
VKPNRTGGKRNGDLRPRASNYQFFQVTVAEDRNGNGKKKNKSIGGGPLEDFFPSHPVRVFLVVVEMAKSLIQPARQGIPFHLFSHLMISARHAPAALSPLHCCTPPAHLHARLFWVSHIHFL